MQGFGFPLFVLMWMGGVIALFVRFRMLQYAYLKRFPPESGFYIENPLLMTPSFGRFRKSLHVMTKRQEDSTLERMRRATWRRYFFMLGWLFGFPVVAIGLIAIVYMTTGYLLLQ